jgi:hypothetical protein
MLSAYRGANVSHFAASLSCAMAPALPSDQTWPERMPGYAQRDANAATFPIQPFEFPAAARFDFLLPPYRRVPFVVTVNLRRESFGFLEQIGQFRFDLRPSLVRDHQLPVSRRQAGHEYPDRPPRTTFAGMYLDLGIGSVFSVTASSSSPTNDYQPI